MLPLTEVGASPRLRTEEPDPRSGQRPVQQDSRVERSPAPPVSRAGARGTSALWGGQAGAIDITLFQSVFSRGIGDSFTFHAIAEIAKLQKLQQLQHTAILQGPD